jgi:hypothetical protein
VYHIRTKDAGGAIVLMTYKSSGHYEPDTNFARPGDDQDTTRLGYGAGSAFASVDRDTGNDRFLTRSPSRRSEDDRMNSGVNLGGGSLRRTSIINPLYTEDNRDSLLLSGNTHTHTRAHYIGIHTHIPHALLD